ncbi:MAG TPA: HDIG domain-containing protein [Ardenticatenaceae bacterium]
MNRAIRAPALRSRLPAQFFEHLYNAVWPLLLWGLLAAVLIVEIQPRQPRLAAGAVSPQSIRAAERITYQSELRTERERSRAVESIESIYLPPDRSQAIRQTSTVQAMAAFLDAVRNDPYASEETKAEYLTALQPVTFDTETARAILSLPEEEWQPVVAETQRLVDSVMRGEIRESRLPDVLRNLPNQMSIALSEAQAEVVNEWAGSLISPNTFQDTERTEQARQAARDAVAPIEVTYEAGQIVIREGEIVTPEQVEALQVLGLQQPARSPLEQAATALFLLLLIPGLMLYIRRAHPEHWANPRAMSLLVVLLVVLSLGARVILPNHVLLAYLLPTSAAAMLLGVLLGVDVAVIVTVALSLIVGYVTNSIEMVTYTFVGGVMAALALWRVERLGVFVWTGVLIGLMNLGVVLAFGLRAEPLVWVDIAAKGGVALVNGAVSASLALAGFYVLSNLLGTTTFLQLMELARPTHPLFRELLLKTPGTYHHSIIVGNLSEGAAEAVGADPLLVRVGAYYHDIGKTKNPHYFIENQVDGINPHDTLNDPYESAELILEHVTEGVRLAQRHKLPRKIVDFIRQHHGTTTVAWFHHKAIEREGAENVDAAHFRYPGPKPQSREMAILMLADTVEATARAMKPAGATEIDQLIRKTIVTKLGEGQLDESDLTLRDLETIRRAFLSILQGIYHPRIAYPESQQAPQALPSPQSDAPVLPEDATTNGNGRAESHPHPDRAAVRTAS